MSGRIVIAEPTPAEVAAVRELSPLVADLTIACGPFAVPMGVLAMPATLELEDSAEGAIARDFVRDHSFVGMGSVSPGGWMLLARDDDTVAIGQREGAVGLGWVAVLERRADGFGMRSMGGWRPDAADDDEEVEVSFRATVDGAEVRACWMNGQDLEGVRDRLFARAVVLEEADAVHFLVISRVNPAVVGRVGFFLGTGRGEEAQFRLRQPLGDRALWCDQRVPPIAVEIAT